MGKLVVIEHLSLDGIMQAPGHPEEDLREGFTQGGWAAKRTDPAMFPILGERMSGQWCLLLGRTTYTHFADHWPKQAGNPFSQILTKVPKFVASRTHPQEALPWENSTHLKGNVIEAVRKLKHEQPGNVVIFGSGLLVQSLLPHGLIDEFVLMFHPLMLGHGRRLFAPFLSAPTNFDLLSATPTKTGVIVAVYQAAPH